MFIYIHLYAFIYIHIHIHIHICVEVLEWEITSLPNVAVPLHTFVCFTCFGLVSLFDGFLCLFDVLVWFVVVWFVILV